MWSKINKILDKAMNDTELGEKMQEAIDEMHSIVKSDQSSEHQKVQAANALSGLVKRYREMFGEDEEEQSDKKESKMGLVGGKGF